MSFQRFYKWGFRSLTNIQRLVDGTDLPVSSLLNGDCVFNTTHENGCAYTANAGSGDGTFMSGDMMQLGADTSGTTYFSNRWVANSGEGITSTTAAVVEGPTAFAYWENAVGVSFLECTNTRNYWAIQHTGITSLNWTPGGTGILRNLVEGDSTEEGRGANAGTGASGTFGTQVNLRSIESGFIEIKIGASEKF
jgi:hypothetical protein